MNGRLKIPAFTLMEVTVAMLVAAVAIAIAYTAYTVVSGSYLAYTRKNGNIGEYIAADKALKREWMQAHSVRAAEEGFTIYGPDTLDYRIENGKLLRRHRLRTDTLGLQVSGYGLTFSGKPAPAGALADRLELDILLEGQKLPAVYSKVYSSAELVSQQAVPGSSFQISN